MQQSRVSATTHDSNIRRLTIVTILDPPYMMLKADSAFLAGNDRFEGYLADILKTLATYVGFEYEIRLSRDGKHGDLHRDRIWDGMLGNIQRGEADMAAGALIVTDKRREYFDFTEPFLSLRSSALIRKPQLQPQRRQSSARSSSSGQHRQRTGQQQATPRARRVHTADQLLASDLSYGVVRHSVVERSMSVSTDPTTRALWSRIATFWPPALVDSVQEGVERARRDKFAFIVDSPMAAYVAGQPPCELYATEPFLDPMTYAFAVRRPMASGSFESAPTTMTPAVVALRQAVDTQLRRMKSTGEMQTMYLRWWRDECGADLDDREFDLDGIPDGRSRDVTPPSVKTGRHVTVSRADNVNMATSCLLLLALIAILLVVT